MPYDFKGDKVGKAMEIAKKLQELECEEEPVWSEEAVMKTLQDGMEKAIRDYLNSPQFKKQYANREELVEEIEKEKIRYNDAVKVKDDFYVVPRNRAIYIIRTHGLEE